MKRRHADLVSGTEYFITVLLVAVWLLFLSTGTAVAAGGDYVWSYTFGDNVWLSPAVAGGYVYVGCYDNKLYCLNAQSGEFEWSYTTGNWVFSSPAVSGGYVFVGSNDSTIYCLNAENSAGSWPIFKGNTARTGETPSLTLKTPNGGESWQIGTTQNITWVTKTISNNLRIVLFKNGVKVGNIVNSIDPALGAYSWTVGSYAGGTATAGTGYQVQIREIGTDAGDRSDANFNLTGP